MVKRNKKASNIRKGTKNDFPKRATTLKSQFNEAIGYIEFGIRAFYWLMAIIVGTFVWFLGSFDKFIMDGIMPNKLIFILGCLSLGVAVILIGIGWIYTWHLIMSLKKFDFETIGIEEDFKIEEFTKALGNLRDSMEDLSKINPPVRGALIFYGVGLTLVFIYILLFILYHA